ncbi:hypothetical protein AB0N17_03130 [Streptomyces sp. NPDC051133]|uniref:hypothetical protein n=1 Tax=Streptomyces sp. NPDC051133 TaxID=3155521 RepID=UPI003428EA96
MGHRPHPSRQRALRQIERHTYELGPVAPPRPLTDFEQQLLDGTATIVKAVAPMVTSLTRSVPPVGEYRISTR